MITSHGDSNTVDLFDNSSVTIHDLPTGGSLFTELNGTAAGDYTGNVTITGFANDLLEGRIDFDGVDGANGASLDVGANPANFINIVNKMTSDGHGGDLIHLLGGGSLDIAGTSSVSKLTFV